MRLSLRFSSMQLSIGATKTIPQLCCTSNSHFVDLIDPVPRGHGESPASGQFNCRTTNDHSLETKERNTTRIIHHNVCTLFDRICTIVSSGHNFPQHVFFLLAVEWRKLPYKLSDLLLTFPPGTDLEPQSLMARVQIPASREP